MIRILYRSELGLVNSQLKVDEIGDAIKDSAGLLWLDMAMEPVEAVEPILANIFGFHPLAIDDALHESHIPKIDDWQDYLYIVLRAIIYDVNEMDQLSLPEIDVFLGPNYIVTFSQERITAVDRVWDTCLKDYRWLSKRADHVLYRLFDAFVFDAISAVEQMHEELDQLEDRIFDAAEPGTLERIFVLKRYILQLRRLVVPQRDVTNKLSRQEYQVIDEIDQIFFRDVYDHYILLVELLNDMFALLGGALDAYLSVVNNRMNDIMKTLTVITALFMPLAFITGFFGMNFFQATNPMEIWTSRIAFVSITVLMLLIPLVMVWWMRHKSWI